ncbi:hypothetical protein G7046_g2419 [Stylonectria norvegica]|nr:hypothetical protein G7046_g2419 [Stylonectria norvegica]
MAQLGIEAPELPPPPQPQSPLTSGTHGFFRKFFGRQSAGNASPLPAEGLRGAGCVPETEEPDKAGLMRRMSRRVVPGLPRTQTFKRQQSERRTNLAPVEPTPDERRAVSVDRRSRGPRASSTSQSCMNPRTSAPGFLGSPEDHTSLFVPSLPVSPVEDEPPETYLDRMVQRDDELTLADECAVQDTLSTADTQSMTTSQFEAMIREELERTWILNLSMHFRDRSRREKFFVTYRERDHLWRRVTISLDYRNAPPNSLEMELVHTQYQRDKSAKIYEAIRESLPDIQFYDTVTNLKLQTTDGRLHVHVVEDGNETIPYPTVAQIQYLGCRRIRERDIEFDSHMSGFVYKVRVNGQTLIKKEIPSPETIEEFLYEVNALNRLRYSNHVIHFYGVVVDDDDQHVKGLLIDYAERGALIDIIFEHCKEGDADLPWSTRQKWARQIVEGLSDVHESGFVQGDFTLSNIVIDQHGDAKIIDINRRGCPVGWEPPEAAPLIESNQRISMYIGVKSDLYQLGMVLWALASQEDEPETQGRPLILGPEVNIPDWYRQMAEICLSDDPRMRLQASSLLQMFPITAHRNDRGELNPPPESIDDEYSLQQYLVEGYRAEDHPLIKTVEPPSDWSYVSRPYTNASPPGYEPYYYTRGRSPPSPLPSNYDRCDSPRGVYDIAAWAANRDIPSSYSDVGAEDMIEDETPIADTASLIDPSEAPTPENMPDSTHISKLEATETGISEIKEGVKDITASGSTETTVLQATNELEPVVKTETAADVDPSTSEDVSAGQEDAGSPATASEVAVPAEVTLVSTVPVVTKSLEANPVEATPAEATPVEATPVSKWHVETKSVEATIDEATPVEIVHVETKSVETKSIGTTPVEATPTEATPTEATPIEAKTVEATSVEVSADNTAPRTDDEGLRILESERNTPEQKPPQESFQLGDDNPTRMSSRAIPKTEASALDMPRLESRTETKENTAHIEGTTAPNIHYEGNTETSSKTVTPPSTTCGPIEDKAVVDLEKHTSNRKDTGVLEENKSTCDGPGTGSFPAPESLTGIGAAHLMNNDDEIMREKETIDDEFNVAAQVLAVKTPPMTTTTDAKT